VPAGRIVVGVDGSACARQALAWAIEEAKLRGDEVVAVHACPYPLLAPTMEGIAPVLPGPDYDRDAQRLLEREIEAVRGEPNGVKVTPRVSELSPAPALVRASDGADLLVLGSRGLGGFTGMVLGSVGQQCAQHAKCPVVIIHDGT
jgi:nucleotide-binding universal stress UspA family protein